MITSMEVSHIVVEIVQQHLHRKILKTKRKLQEPYDKRTPGLFKVEAQCNKMADLEIDDDFESLMEVNDDEIVSKESFRPTISHS